MNATPPALTLFSALASRKALDEGLLDEFSLDHGVAVEVDYDPTTELLRRIAAGERPDVLIAVTSSLGPLAAAGIVDAASITPLFRTAVGVGVLEGAPIPDVSTTAAFVRAMLDARSVAYSQAGASGIYLREVLDRLGILEAVRSRATVLDKGFTGTALVDGRADLAVQQLSELAFVPGVTLAGPFPAELQSYTDFSVAVGAGAADRPEATALVHYLAGAHALTAYEKSGLEAPE